MMLHPFQLEEKLKKNPFKLGNLKYALGKFDSKRSLFGIFTCKNFDGIAALMYDISMEKSINYFICKKTSPKKLMEYLVHETIHLFYPTLMYNKEDYWTVEDAVDKETNRFLNENQKELIGIYSNLMKGEPQGIFQVNSKKDPLIKRILQMNLGRIKT